MVEGRREKGKKHPARFEQTTRKTHVTILSVVPHQARIKGHLVTVDRRLGESLV